MTTTPVLVGRSGDKPKLPSTSYVPTDKKRFIIEVGWWQRLEHWPTSLAQIMDPAMRGQNPAFTVTPLMRENRYCQSMEEVEAFIAHCKRYTALNKPGYVTKV